MALIKKRCFLHFFPWESLSQFPGWNHEDEPVGNCHKMKLWAFFFFWCGNNSTNNAYTHKNPQYFMQILFRQGKKTKKNWMGTTRATFQPKLVAHNLNKLFLFLNFQQFLLPGTEQSLAGKSGWLSFVEKQQFQGKKRGKNLEFWVKAVFCKQKGLELDGLWVLPTQTIPGLWMSSQNPFRPPWFPPCWEHWAKLDPNPKLKEKKFFASFPPPSNPIKHWLGFSSSLNSWSRKISSRKFQNPTKLEPCLCGIIYILGIEKFPKQKSKRNQS